MNETVNTTIHRRERIEYLPTVDALRMVTEMELVMLLMEAEPTKFEDIDIEFHPDKYLIYNNVTDTLLGKLWIEVDEIKEETFKISKDGELMVVDSKYKNTIIKVKYEKFN